MFASVQKNYVRFLFPVTLLLLCISLIYISTMDPLRSQPDLCKLWKERISVIKNYENSSKQWWEWACLLEREWDKGSEYTCQDLRLIGNYHICFDEPYRPKPPCLVYSFGIDHDFRFDDKMAELGCDVYSFDPSMGLEDHQRSEKVRFLNLGLATTDSDNFKPLMDGYTSNEDQTWRIRKLDSIKKMLGHEDTPLDILKMDVETYEWAIMQQLVKDGSLHTVKQLALEWHIFPNDPFRTEFQNMFTTYMDLKKMGFRQYFSSPGGRYHSRLYFNSQLDNSLVNTLFTEKPHKTEA